MGSVDVVRQVGNLYNCESGLISGHPKNRKNRRIKGWSH